ncbi:MAG: PEGA domain-containing protein [Myxococcales bacterium]|nr:PEGA domain-containing protein [Myxococcales bacterium]
MKPITSPIAWTAALGLLVLSLASGPVGCGVPSSQVRTTPNTGYVVFKVKPEEATVYVDGAAIGQAEDFDEADSALGLTSGKHVIELKHPGYQDYRREVYAGHVVQMIEVSLAPN